MFENGFHFHGADSTSNTIVSILNRIYLMILLIYLACGGKRGLVTSCSGASNWLAVSAY